MSFNFKDIVEKHYEERLKATAPVPEVDAFQFLIGSKWLDETPFPFQSLVIKLLYGLWEKYPLTQAEIDLLEVLKNNWGINLDLENRDINTFIEVLILVVGRRGTKTSLISFIQTYETYKLICKGNPQKYYGIRERHPIEVLNMAKDGEQAKSPFVLTKNNIKRIEFFAPYIDYSKDNESELRLFSPADLYENQKIRKYNETKPVNAPKKNLMEGTITISAITTSAASKRGKATLCLIFDEFAHFDRARLTAGNESDQDILTEMPQTDYAMFKALTPSVKDFGKDGKILCISSPREKGGYFYRLYCMAGGREQTNPNAVTPQPNYLMLQLSTWEANPNKPRSIFDLDFARDPIGCLMEFAAHFADPSSTFIDPMKVDEMIDVNKSFTTTGMQGFGYIITVDPAKNSDTYVVTWGHTQSNRGIPEFHIDGTYGFKPPFVIENGIPKKTMIDPDKVTLFISNLAASIQRNGGHVLEICYDQWNSSACISALSKMGYPAVETFFSNQYKEKIYTNFLEKVNLSQVKCFGMYDPTQAGPLLVPYVQGWLEQAKLEIKYLQRISQGNTTFYEAPTSGPVTNDDFSDTFANLIHRLALRINPDLKTMKELYKQTGKPVRGRFGGNMTRGSSGFFPTNPMKDIKGRILGR